MLDQLDSVQKPNSTPSYKNLLKEVKERIKSSQLKAVVSVNRELINLYWEIGKSIQEKQETEDLRSSFSGVQGFFPYKFI